jgi:hypothetical protein
LSGKSTVIDPSELAEVLEREGQLGYRPVELYSKHPFTTIVRLMEKEGLSTTDLGAFTRWKAKDDNMKEARASKAKKRRKSKKAEPTAKMQSFFEFKKRKQPIGEL